MKNIDILPIPDESKKRLTEFSNQYKRFAKIYIEIVSFIENRLIVRVEQKELVNGKQLTKEELTTRVRDLLKDEIPKEWKLTVSAVDYDRIDIANVNAEYINKKLEKLDIKAKSLSSYTGIDKSTISQILADKKELTKWHKLAFYYFFKYYELSNFKDKDKCLI